MAIRQHLKSFWWFVDDRVGGMGRPGFNRINWYDLPFEEAILMSWVGKQTKSQARVQHLHDFGRLHGVKVAQFYGVSASEAMARLEPFQDESHLVKHLESLNDKASILDRVEIRNGTLTILPHEKRLREELKILKDNNVQVVVSLLEDPINTDIVSEFFEVHHFAIEDLAEPHLEQVCAYANVLRDAKDNNKIIVTHCLAGIGRTTTMLFAAHLLHGHTWDEVSGWVSERNPNFKLVGKQAEFLHNLRHTLTR